MTIVTDSLYKYSDLFNKYIQEKDFQKATNYARKMKEVWDKEGPDKDSTYCIFVENISRCYMAINNFDEALALLTELLPFKRNVYGHYSLDYAMFLDNLAELNASLFKYPEAIRYKKEAKEIYGKKFGIEHPGYFGALGFLAEYYYASGKYPEAISYGLEAKDICKKVLGANHTGYATFLCNVAKYYFAQGNYQEALSLGTEAMEIFKKIVGTEHSFYATSLTNVSIYSMYQGKYAEAIRLGTEAKEIYRKIVGTEHSDYATSLNQLAQCYSASGNNWEAVRLASDATAIFKQVFGTDHPSYATSLGNLAAFNSDKGDNIEAIRLATEAMDIFRKAKGKEHPDYARALNILATCNLRSGKWQEAIYIGREAKDIFRKVFGTKHPDYAMSLCNLAKYYSALGDNQEAVGLGTEAVTIFEHVYGKEHPAYATALSNLTDYYYFLGNNSEAIRLGTEAMEIRKKVLGENHPDYATSLCNLAKYNSRLGNNLEAVRLGVEAIKICKKTIGTEHPNYAILLSDLAKYYSTLDNKSEAIRIGANAVDVYKNTIGNEHPYYAECLMDLAHYNMGLGNSKEVYQLLSEATTTSQNYIFDCFSELTPHLQESLWITSYDLMFVWAFPSMVFRYQTNESVSELFDKTALFAKSILLNSSIGMRTLILESGDSILLSKYDVLAVNRSIYDKLLEKSTNERSLYMDSLYSIIQNQEMELARDSKVFGDFARDTRINWKDVQQKLGSDDIAIEFLDFPLFRADSTMYVALTLKQGYDCPHMIPLFEKRQLNSIPKKHIYISTDMYNLVWLPLEEELAGVKNIYFAPSGELHRIAIENIPVTTTEYICDRYNMRRLSSTRQLVCHQDETLGEKSVVYGGLKYDAIISDTVAAASSMQEREFSYVPHANVDSLKLQSSYEYLPGTKEETDSIVANLSIHAVPYSYYYGATGTEESFKSLDGTKPKLLHIATHGFYMSEEDAVRKDFVLLPFMNNEKVHREDKAMTRSGLMLSGCSHALNHETIPENVEDGILTAEEISKLDLRGLDLVVLSACQTGLGDIISGEGVFGLQRGFKKAGAKTILMSLWKVNDDATQLLMTEFYKNYCQGKDKCESLRLAQKAVREDKDEDGNLKYDKPYYWAGFVMLDGFPFRDEYK